jgi:opacity protein-like surface antigen
MKTSHFAIPRPALRLLAIAAAVTSLPVFAQTDPEPAQQAAQPQVRPSPFYLSVSGGANLQSDQRFKSGAPLTSPRAEYKTGPAARVAIGYKWKKGFIKWLKPRTEIEVAYSRADVRGSNAGLNGSVDTTTIKLGLASDIRWSDTQTVVPYFGSGYGIAIVDASVRSPTYAIGGNRTRFAQHNSLGVSYTGMAGMDIYAEGRYSKVSGANFNRDYSAAAITDDRVRAKTKAFEVSVGTRLRF